MKTPAIRNIIGLRTSMQWFFALMAFAVMGFAHASVEGTYEHDKGMAKLIFKAPNTVTMRLKDGQESKGTFTVNSQTLVVKFGNDEEEFEIRLSGRVLKAKDAFGGTYTKK